MAAISFGNGLRLIGRAWYLRKTVRGANGKSIPRDIPLKIYGTDKEAQARAAAEKRAAEIDGKNADMAVLDRYPGLKALSQPTTAVPTLNEWWAKYEKAYAAERRTSDDIARMIKAWLALPRTTADKTLTTWGESRLDEITKSDCKLAIRARRATKKQHGTGTLSEGSVRKEQGAVQAFFERAIEDEIVDRINPFVTIKKGSDQKRERLLEVDHEPALLAALPEDRVRRIVRFMILSGVRVGGAIALRQTDLRGELAHVSEKSPTSFDACSTCGRAGRKCRNVWITTEGRQILAEQIAADGELWGGVQLRKAMMSEDYVEKAVARAVVYADIPKVSPHDFRHTFAFRWVEKGGDIDTLSQILGHSSSQVTQRYYKHLRDDLLARKMRAVLEPTTATPPEPPAQPPAPDDAPAVATIH